jgi:hypothetical protein
VEVDGFIKGVDVNSGNGSVIILSNGGSVEPQIFLEALGTAYGFIEPAFIDTHIFQFKAGVHVLTEQLVSLLLGFTLTMAVSRYVRAAPCL